MAIASTQAHFFVEGFKIKKVMYVINGYSSVIQQLVSQPGFPGLIGFRSHIFAFSSRHSHRRDPDPQQTVLLLYSQKTSAARPVTR